MTNAMGLSQTKARDANPGQFSLCSHVPRNPPGLCRPGFGFLHVAAVLAAYFVEGVADLAQ
ncbi:MAG: hypothetical protein ICCCNLDF_01956 [Planctomycetes bacterium]|nr:hypothetical protein [Planctomycetota bacterium]